MKRYTYGESVQGASHKRQGKPCQDSHRIDLNKEIAIISVADGHGSESCPYSKTGSVIAVNVFNAVMAAYYSSYHKRRNGMNALLRFLNREGEVKVAKTIDAEWKRRVYKQHCNNHREVPLKSDGTPDKEKVYRLYGSTLLGVFISKDYIFSLQLGDGDITYIDKELIAPVLTPDKSLGVETHSISGIDSWRRVKSCIQIRKNKTEPHLYMLTTDGMANSYATQAEFENSCKEYFETIQENGFEAVEDNLNGWLNETSEQGCGDDVTAVFAYFE